MKIKLNWSVKDIKKYLKKISKESWGDYSKEKQAQKIMIMLECLELEYTKFRSSNGYIIFEVYELYFIIETEKRFKLIEISKKYK